MTNEIPPDSEPKRANQFLLYADASIVMPPDVAHQVENRRRDLRSEADDLQERVGNLADAMVTNTAGEDAVPQIVSLMGDLVVTRAELEKLEGGEGETPISP